MLFNSIRDENPSLQSEIVFDPQYLNDDEQVVCYPDSVFEGTVIVTATKPTLIQSIHIVFTAAEKPNHEAFLWREPKDKEGRLFTSSNVLLENNDATQNSSSSIPVFQPGKYPFPFACQMPLVNYPPTCPHHFIKTHFKLFVSIKEFGRSPVLTKPTFLQFLPMVETTPTKNSHPQTQLTSLSQSTSAHVTLPQLAYSIKEVPLIIPILVQFFSRDPYFNVSHLDAYITCREESSYKSYFRSEDTIIVSHHMNSLRTRRFTVPLEVPRKTLPTINYCKHLKIEYRLVVTIKTRYGPFCLKNILFDSPLLLGTLSPGLKAPLELKTYNIENESRPSFQTPMDKEEYLPVYKEEESPPAYHLDIQT